MFAMNTIRIHEAQRNWKIINILMQHDELKEYLIS